MTVNVRFSGFEHRYPADMNVSTGSATAILPRPNYGPPPEVVAPTRSLRTLYTSRGAWMTLSPSLM
jgi:hypothetical protein